MTNLKTILVFFVLTTIFGCGVPEGKYQELQNDNNRLHNQIDTLTSQLNDLKFGATSLLRKARLEIDDKRFENAKILLTTIVNKYYSSKEAFIAKRLLKVVNPIIEESFFYKAKNDTGVYLMQNYVRQYPDGKFLNQAKSIIEEKSWLTLNTNSKSELENFINNYPNSIYVDQAQNLIIKDEVNDVFQGGNYRKLPPLTQNFDSGTEEFSANSQVIIENNTSYLLTILYSGLEQKRISINSNASKSILLKNGNYRIVAYVNASNVSTYAGEEQLNGQYSSSYYISPSNSYDNYNPNSSTTTTPTYRTQPNYQDYKTRIGAICCDGSRSSATGSGACSHHGGVCQWLYQ